MNDRYVNIIKFFLFYMKYIINKTLDKQGLSLQKLSYLIDAPFRTLQEAKNGNNYLNKLQIKKLIKLYKSKSLVIKPKDSAIKNINGIKYLDVYNIFSTHSRTGFKIYSKTNGQNILFWYQSKCRGASELLLPQYILLDEKFFISLGLSIGDGLNNPNIKNTHYNFVNTNLQLVRIIYDWLLDYIKFNKDKIQIFAFSNNNHTYSEKELISQALNIDFNFITIYKGFRNKKLDLVIQLSNPLFQCFYLNLLNKLKFFILSNKEYRLAFINSISEWTLFWDSAVAES